MVPEIVLKIWKIAQKIVQKMVPEMVLKIKKIV